MEKTLLSPRTVFTVRSAPFADARTRIVQLDVYGFSASSGSTEARRFEPASAMLVHTLQVSSQLPGGSCAAAQAQKELCALLDDVCPGSEERLRGLPQKKKTR